MIRTVGYIWRFNGADFLKAITSLRCIEDRIAHSHSENNDLPFPPVLFHLSLLIGWISLITASVFADLFSLDRDCQVFFKLSNNAFF